MIDPDLAISNPSFNALEQNISSIRPDLDQPDGDVLVASLFQEISIDSSPTTLVQYRLNTHIQC